ncbi:MAG: TlpA family protein disulfide reductase, partial [Planctomycetota bacterium]
TAPGSEPADSQADSVSLMIKSWEETQKFIASQDADLIVVDFWSTSCVPCLREFPHLVELYEKYHDRGVQCISVSCDYEGIADMPPESLVPAVLAFLRKQRATFPNILLSTPSDDFYDAFDLGSIPAVAVYARGGKLLKRFDNDEAESEEDSFTYEKDVIPFVERQLMQRNPATQ